jgi:mRNA interferase MazF
MSYIPDRGDIVWLNFSPQTGREQAGRRPALVLSPQAYNGKVGLLIACPITSQAKGYPFEVSIPDGLSIRGVILSDQIKSLDWRRREIEFIAQLPTSTTNQVILKLETLIGPGLGRPG